MFRFITVLGWDRDLSIEHEHIDGEHQQLVALVNRVHQGIVQRAPDADISNHLAELRGYTEAHFAQEEDLMRVVGYPRYRWHARYHRVLIKMLADNEARVFKTEQADRFEFVEFLNGWLVDHIQTADTHFGRFLAKYDGRAWQGRILTRFRPSDESTGSSGG